MDSLDNVVHKYGSAEHVVKRRGHPIDEAQSVPPEKSSRPDDSASTPMRPTKKSSRVTVSMNIIITFIMIVLSSVL